MLYIIKPQIDDLKRKERLNHVIDRALTETGIDDVTFLETAEQVAERDLTGQKVLFAVALDSQGMNFQVYRLIAYMRENSRCFRDSTGAIVVDGGGELFTKNTARELVFAANSAGMMFPGKSLVEATGSLYNFNTLAKISGVDNFTAYEMQVAALVEKLVTFERPKVEKKKILAVHGGNRKTSNSLMLWDKVRTQLGDNAEITEVSLRNGDLVDCRGCKYEECLHFGEKGSCYYGGIIVEQVYPAILECDALVMICPNYNDALSANVTAFINRLTAIFRTNDFSRKEIFGIIVSGYSGGDIVAQQIIGAMSFNKNMILPPDFAMIETANDPGSILAVRNIEGKAHRFAENIMK